LQGSGSSRELKIAAIGPDVRRLPDRANQLHRDPAVSFGSEMNMVGLQHAGLPHDKPLEVVFPNGPRIAFLCDTSRKNAGVNDL
jgi:hypothetical protein